MTSSRQARPAAAPARAAVEVPAVGSDLHGPTLLTDADIYLFKEGNHFKLWDKLGAHLLTVDGRDGAHFAVWAPNASSVSVIGDFNRWDARRHPLAVRWDGSGIWEGFVPRVGKGALYKYAVTAKNGARAEKTDPFGFFSEAPPRSASIVWDLDYRWSDGDWMARRAAANALSAPVSIYEVHLCSWRRVPGSE